MPVPRRSKGVRFNTWKEGSLVSKSEIQLRIQRAKGNGMCQDFMLLQREKTTISMYIHMINSPVTTAAYMQDEYPETGLRWLLVESRITQKQGHGKIPYRVTYNINYLKQTYTEWIFTQTNFNTGRGAKFTLVYVGLTHTHIEQKPRHNQPLNIETRHRSPHLDSAKLTSR